MLQLLLSSPAASALVPPSAFHRRPYADRPGSEPSRRGIRVLQLPLAASISFILFSSPVNAGVLTGFSGLEAVPGPQLPQFDFLNKWNDNNQKKYAELDSKFKSSKILQEFLEKTKINKERNLRKLQDKYCLRGAEWGIGDCSTEGMTPEDRDAFIAELRKRADE